MDLKRFFSDNINYAEKTATLTDEEYYHAVKVTRHKIGYKLIICGDGEHDYYCTVKDIGDGVLYATIDGREKNTAETKLPITLYVGANKDLDTVVQKAVELGVSKIVPFVSDHCNVDKINSDRLNKIISESSKQCGRARLAEICELISFKKALDTAKQCDVAFFYEYAKKKRVADCEFGDKGIAVFIGCEGGFSKAEIESVIDCGIEPITLGKRILRVSTAVTAALALVEQAIGEM